MLRRAITANQARVNGDPRNPLAWLNLGEAHFLLGDSAAAVAAWEKAQSLGLAPRALWYIFWPAIAYNRLGQPQRVIALTQTAIAQQPASPELLLEQGLAYIALGDRAKGRQALTQALVYAPQVYSPPIERARRALAELGPG